MKKYRMRNWVKLVLSFIMLLGIVLMGSDSNDIKTFMMIHLIGLFTFIGAAFILLKFEEVKL